MMLKKGLSLLLHKHIVTSVNTNCVFCLFQVKHLEVSCSSMAEDICRKSAIIETYVMDSRRGEKSFSSPHRNIWNLTVVSYEHLWFSFCFNHRPGTFLLAKKAKTCQSWRHERVCRQEWSESGDVVSSPNSWETAMNVMSGLLWTSTLWLSIINNS